MPGESQTHQYDGFHRRLQVITLVLVAAMGVLVMRLWSLQIIRGAEFSVQSDQNRLRPQRLEAPRGMILAYDAGQPVVLADNRPARDLLFVPAECDQDMRTVLEWTARVAGVDPEPLIAEAQKAIEARQPHRQITIRRDVSRGILARIEEYAYALPGVITVTRPQRRYLYGKTAGQIMGYLNEIGPDELETRKDRYQMGDLIGRSGLEMVYEDLLRGRDGRMLVTKFATGLPQVRTDPYGQPFVATDEFGHLLKIEERIQEPVPGSSLQITLDTGLQATAEELLLGEEGAIVVLNAETGAVLAMASAPSYDPNIFVMRGTSDRRREALYGESKRMLHRAFREAYAPGSVFKVLMASAALEEGVIDENTTYYCPGSFRLAQGGRAWRCWRRSGHGRVNVVDALAFSCDVFFYNVGLELGVDRMHAWATKAGLGVATGIDLPNEVSGLVPSREWKERLLKPKFPDQPWEYRWYPGDTVNFSIGQGSMTATPLQNAVLMAAIVNGGRRITPHLREDAAAAPSQPLWSERTLRIVRAGMQKCVEKGPPAPTGTGREARVPGLTVLGKTGSAQMVGLEHHAEYENEEDIPKHLRDHAWFVAGVLDGDPPIALCVLVEHGHHGSSEAAPLAKKIIEYFYTRIGVRPAQPEPDAVLARGGESGG